MTQKNTRMSARRKSLSGREDVPHPAFSPGQTQASVVTAALEILQWQGIYNRRQTKSHATLQRFMQRYRRQCNIYDGIQRL